MRLWTPVAGLPLSVDSRFQRYTLILDNRLTFLREKAVCFTHNAYIKKNPVLLCGLFTVLPAPNLGIFLVQRHLFEIFEILHSNLSKAGLGLPFYNPPQNCIMTLMSALLTEQVQSSAAFEQKDGWYYSVLLRHNQS